MQQMPFQALSPARAKHYIRWTLILSALMITAPGCSKRGPSMGTGFERGIQFAYGVCDNEVLFLVAFSNQAGEVLRMTSLPGTNTEARHCGTRILELEAFGRPYHIAYSQARVTINNREYDIGNGILFCIQEDQITQLDPGKLPSPNKLDLLELSERKDILSAI